MREDKKVSSIARRINAYWTRRTMLLMGLLDAVLGTMIAASWITALRGVKKVYGAYIFISRNILASYITDSVNMGSRKVMNNRLPVNLSVEKHITSMSATIQPSMRIRDIIVNSRPIITDLSIYPAGSLLSASRYTVYMHINIKHMNSPFDMIHSDIIRYGIEHTKAAAAIPADIFAFLLSIYLLLCSYRAYTVRISVLILRNPCTPNPSSNP